MGSKNTGGSPPQESTNYPRKYWWVILIVLPVLVAFIQYQPWKMSSGSSDAGRVSGNQFFGPAIVGNVSLVVADAARAGTTLDPSLIEQIKSAATLSRAGDHDAAVAQIEQIRATL